MATQVLPAWLCGLSAALSASFGCAEDVDPATAGEHSAGPAPVCVRGLVTRAEWSLAGAEDASTGLVDSDRLLSLLGRDARVPVQLHEGGERGEGLPTPTPPSYAPGRRVHMRLEAYVHLLVKGGGAECGYLKDWHFAREGGVLSSPLPLYGVPAPFLDDALNSWFDAHPRRPDSPAVDDFRFLYAGGGGSETLLHHDVVGSCSWSVNVVGWKLWLFAPPAWSRTHLYHPTWRTLLAVHDLLSGEERGVVRAVANASLSRPQDAQGPPPTRDGAGEGGGGEARVEHDLWREARRCIDTQRGDGEGGACPACRGQGEGGSSGSEVEGGCTLPPSPRHQRVLWCLSGPGDGVYVPPLWHHQVVNLGCPPPVQPTTSTPPTGRALANAVVSVNHNWAGGAHLPTMWGHLSREWACAYASLLDCSPGGGREQDPFLSPLPRRAPSSHPPAAWAAWYTTLDAVTGENAGLGVGDFGSLVLFRARGVVGVGDRLWCDAGVQGGNARAVVHPAVAVAASSLLHLGTRAVRESVEGLLSTLAQLAAHAVTAARELISPPHAHEEGGARGGRCLLLAHEQPEAWRRADLQRASEALRGVLALAYDS